MRQVIRKWVWAWEFDKEEKWLNDMAAQGKALVSARYATYEFEGSEPGEYAIRLEMLENAPDSEAGMAYISFVEETGAEQVGSYLNWVYFRKKGQFEIFSDYSTKIKHLSRIISLVALLAVLNLAAFLYNLIVVILIIGEPVGLMSCINLFLAIFSGIGMHKLRKKREALKNEQRVFE